MLVGQSRKQYNKVFFEIWYYYYIQQVYFLLTKSNGKEKK